MIHHLFLFRDDMYKIVYIEFLFSHQTGYKDLGTRLLDRFKWGHTFYEVNNDLLQKYAACTNSVEVVAAQDAYLKQIEQESIDAKKDGKLIYSSHLIRRPLLQ